METFLSAARDTTAPRAIGRDAAFWLVAYALAVTIMGNNIPAPLYPIYQGRWHFSTGVLTAIFAVVAVGVVPALLVFGPLSDRIGRRPVLLAGLALSTIATCAFIAAQGAAWLAVARVVQGVAFGAMSGTAVAALAELRPQRAALVSTTAIVSSQAVAPLLSGTLAQYAPWPTTLVYVLLLALLVPALIGAWILPETAPPHARGQATALRIGVPRAILAPFALASLAVFAAFGVLGMVSALGPSFVGSILHVQNRAVGGLVVFALLGTSALAQVVGRGWPVRRDLVLGPLLLAAGLAVFVLALPRQALVPFLAGTVCAGFGQGLTFLGSLRVVTGVAPAAERAGILSTFNIVVYLAASAAALAVGLGARFDGLYAATVVVAAVIGAAAICAALIGARSGILAPAATG